MSSLSQPSQAFIPKLHNYPIPPRRHRQFIFRIIMAHWLRVSYPPLICARVHRATMLPLTRRSSFIDLVCLSPFPHPSTSSSAGSNAIIVCLPCLFVSRSTHRRRGGVRRGTTNNKRSFAPTQRTRQQRTQTDRQTANQPTNERTNTSGVLRPPRDLLAWGVVVWPGHRAEDTANERTTNDERRTTNDERRRQRRQR